MVNRNRSVQVALGESEIRRWIIENDWLEAIIALPEGGRNLAKGLPWAGSSRDTFFCCRMFL